MATQLGLELARLGHKVHFLSHEKPFGLDVTPQNITFHEVGFMDYLLFKYPDYTRPLAVRMGEIAKKYKLDIFHMHYAVPHGTAGLLAKNIAQSQGEHFPAIITTLHGTDITLLGRDKSVMPVIKYTTEQCDGVTAVSESLKKDTIKLLKTKKAIKVIHNFYVPKEPKKSSAAIRKSLGISPEDFFIIHLSNLRPVKRIPDLIAIMAKVKKYTDQNKKARKVKLLVLSGGDFTQYIPLVKKFGLQKNVIIKERIHDIENYITAADLGLYTSSQESFGLAILETMAYGKPVLATRVGGIPEFMKNGKTGYLFPVGAVDAFSEKIIKLSNNPDLGKRLGQAGKEVARSKFSAQKKVEEYVKYYRKIAGLKV